MSDPVIEASEALDSGWKRVREVVKGMFKGDSMPFFVICLAGLMGGALSESAFNLAGARVLPGSDLPTRMALGMVAAGVGTLILANSDRRDRLRLFFFAMLCGLCYPNVIGQAMSDVERRAKEGTESRDLAVQKSVIAATPADKIRPEVKDAVEQNIVASINQAGAQKNNAETIKEITEIGQVARENGYDGAAMKAAETLRKLGAGNAVDAVISDVPVAKAD